MSESKYTLGPWRVAQLYNVISDQGKIAKCDSRSRSTDNSHEVDKANASLISAAPELLTAVKLSKELIESLAPVFAIIDKSQLDKIGGIVTTMNMIIAKAEGRDE